MSIPAHCHTPIMATLGMVIPDSRGKTGDESPRDVIESKPFLQLRVQQPSWRACSCIVPSRKLLHSELVYDQI